MTTYSEILDKAGIGNLKTIMTTYGKILDKAGIGNFKICERNSLVKIDLILLM